MRRRKLPIEPDLTGGQLVSQIPEVWAGSQPPEKPMPPRDGVSSTPGVIRETCSCSATIEAPATELGRDTVADWRHAHRHAASESGSQSKEREPSTTPATGELRHESARFGFYRPVVEAAKEDWSKPRIHTVPNPGAKPKPPPPPPPPPPKGK